MTRHPIFPFFIALSAAVALTAHAAPAGAKPASGAAHAAAKASRKTGPSSTPAPAHGAASPGAAKPGAKGQGMPGGAAHMPHGFEANRPWAAGVSAADQKKAVALFEQGNKLLQQSLYSDAVKMYSAALKHWDHPAIHYNMALALSNLDQPVRLYQNLKKAVAYGVAPLDKAKFDNAKSYMKLIGATLATVDIDCKMPGAKVSMDGKLLFTAPGHYHGLTLAGDHNIVAAKAGYVTDNQTRTLEPGSKTGFHMHLYTAEQLTRYRRHWSRWKPWAVVGAGAAIGVVGGVLQLVAQGDFSSYDTGIHACQPPSMMLPGGGCAPDSHLSGLQSTAQTAQVAAIVSYAVAGAAIVGGVALVYANRPQPYRVEADQAAHAPARVTVAPLFGGGTTGVTALFRF